MPERRGERLDELHPHERTGGSPPAICPTTRGTAWLPVVEPASRPIVSNGESVAQVAEQGVRDREAHPEPVDDDGRSVSCRRPGGPTPSRPPGRTGASRSGSSTRALGWSGSTGSTTVGRFGAPSNRGSVQRVESATNETISAVIAPKTNSQSGTGRSVRPPIAPCASAGAAVASSHEAATAGWPTDASGGDLQLEQERLAALQLAFVDACRVRDEVDPRGLVGRHVVRQVVAVQVHSSETSAWTTIRTRSPCVTSNRVGPARRRSDTSPRSRSAPARGRGRALGGRRRGRGGRGRRRRCRPCAPVVSSGRRRTNRINTATTVPRRIAHRTHGFIRRGYPFRFVVPSSRVSVCPAAQSLR